MKAEPRAKFRSCPLLSSDLVRSNLWTRLREHHIQQTKSYSAELLYIPFIPTNLFIVTIIFLFTRKPETPSFLPREKQQRAKIQDQRDKISAALVQKSFDPGHSTRELINNCEPSKLLFIEITNTQIYERHLLKGYESRKILNPTRTH